jgi:hypothetical protein
VCFDFEQRSTPQLPQPLLSIPDKRNLQTAWRKMSKKGKEEEEKEALLARAT